MAAEISGRMEARIDGLLSSKAGRGAPPDGFKGDKVVSEVLDRPAVMALYGLMRSGEVTRVHGPAGAGKESVVFRADGPDGPVALKVYLVTAASFRRRARYMDGDPRFGRVRRGTRNMVHAWARREFASLRLCRARGLPVPRPICVSKNVLAMEFVGSGCEPAPTLARSRVDAADYGQYAGIVGGLWRRAGLAHGDLSPYNIFKTEGGLVAFDMGSAVDSRHPGAAGLLRRDLSNMARFFARRGLEVENPADLLRRIAP